MNEQQEIPEGVFERINALCLRLPEVTVRVDESRVITRSTAFSFEIRRRSFCLLIASADAPGGPAAFLILRASPEEREAMLSYGYPYFAPRSGPGRIGVLLQDNTDYSEIRELVMDSYRILAPKKLVARLDELD